MDRCPHCHGPLTGGFTAYGIAVQRCQLTGRPVVRQLPVAATA